MAWLESQRVRWYKGIWVVRPETLGTRSSRLRALKASEGCCGEGVGALLSDVHVVEVGDSL